MIKHLHINLDIVSMFSLLNDEEELIEITLSCYAVFEHM